LYPTERRALGLAAIGQGHRVLYREAHVLIEELLDAVLDDRHKKHMRNLGTVPLLIIDDLGMRKLPAHAAEDLLEIIMRRYERASTILTSKPSHRGLGQAARRHRGRHRHAQSPPPPRPHPQVRTPELAVLSAEDFGEAPADEVITTHLSQTAPPMAALRCSPRQGIARANTWENTG